MGLISKVLWLEECTRGGTRTLNPLRGTVFETVAYTNSATLAWEAKCGAEGDRTPDLLHAMQALSQLSYSPKMKNGRQL